jgi:ABC-type sulfate transport system permease component
VSVPLPRRLRQGGTLGLVVLGLAAGAALLVVVAPLLALFRATSAGAVIAAAEDPGVRASLVLTLYASGWSLLVVLGIGVPLGYLFARRRFPGQFAVESVVALPIVLPHLIGGLALFLLFAPGGTVGRFLASAGLPVWETVWGVVAVMVYVSLPYTVFASETAFLRVDGRALEAARSLGASPAEAFATITLPAALRGILSGALLSWARAISEIGGFLILAFVVYPSGAYGGPVSSPISVFIYQLYQVGDVGAALAASALLVLVALAIFLAARWAAHRGSVAWSWIGGPAR